MNGAQAVIAALEREGVETIFGYPGGAIMPLYDALYEHPVRHVLVRHEAAAVFAASGYARTSGRVGVCCATSGPGATNLVTGLLDAMMDSVPLVAITGQVRTELMGTDGFQEADVCAITQPITKRNMLVTSADAIAPTLAEAFALARSGRPGPVLVDIPSDVLKAQTTTDVTAAPMKTFVRGGAGPRVSDAAVREAVARIRSARRPVAIIGGGVRAGAVDLYRMFVAMLGLPHAATINALGAAAPGDASYLGMLGMHGLKAANKAVQRADLIVALGMRFDDRVTGKPDRFAREATVIHADIDATEFNKIIGADVALHGDLRDTLRALIDELARGHVPRFDDWAAEARLLGGPLPSDRVAGSVLSATDVLDRVFAALPGDAIVTTDVGQH
ncbi:MAG: acetolactate synthase large subunit, partial [Candidatus Eremiobacteraeota bacterium]|nr:acetolactate synthase large subunit [Candidatus Eremiobacteraeota bacterium]